LLELIVALVLIALNGLFSLSELALKTLADQGRAGAATALALADDPGRFLSTVQIGITLVGILAGAFSGAALGERLTGYFDALGVPDAAAEPLGYGLVIGAITYLSVVVGELVPKHLALKNPEGIACSVAPPMALVSKLCVPVVALLDTSPNSCFGSSASPRKVRTPSRKRK